MRASSLLKQGSCLALLNENDAAVSVLAAAVSAAERARGAGDPLTAQARVAHAAALLDSGAHPHPLAAQIRRYVTQLREGYDSLRLSCGAAVGDADTRTRRARDVLISALLNAGDDAGAARVRRDTPAGGAPGWEAPFGLGIVRLDAGDAAGAVPPLRDAVAAAPARGGEGGAAFPRALL
eukprot:gene1493-10226_t